MMILALGAASFPADAHAFWILNPKTKKMINPKTEPRPSPAEQFEYARSLYEVKNYVSAITEFKKLLKNYPKSKEAAESQYYLGLSEDASGRPYEAFQAYQKVIDKYPFSTRIQEIIEKQYALAERFIEGEKRKALGVNLPVENPAIEILTKVVENSTYGPLAAKAQYKLGLVLKQLQRYYEAEEAFNKVLSRYPESDWVEPAKFQIAECRAAVSRGPAYDQGAAQEAKEKFEEFVRDNPDAELSDKAEENISALNEKEAQANFETAVFYEKQKAYDSAAIYYNDVIDSYPHSSWAVKALERLQRMEKGRKR